MEGNLAQKEERAFKELKFNLANYTSHRFYNYIIYIQKLEQSMQFIINNELSLLFMIPKDLGLVRTVGGEVNCPSHPNGVPRYLIVNHQNVNKQFIRKYSVIKVRYPPSHDGRC